MRLRRPVGLLVTAVLVCGPMSAGAWLLRRAANACSRSIPTTCRRGDIDLVVVLVTSN